MSCDGEGSSFSAYSKLFSQAVSSSDGEVGMAPLTLGGVTPDQCGFDGEIAEVFNF